MRIKFAIALVLIAFSECMYLFAFKTLSNDYILAHSWKGGGHGLPDVLDFRGGALRLHGDDLYMENTLLGRIVNRKYRFHADSYLDIMTDAGEICRYWDKWTN